MPSYLSNSYNATKQYLGGTVLGDTGFFFHFSAYVLVNLILIAVNLIFTPDKLWFYWPLLGWGVGIAAHAASVFGTGRFLGKEWEERKIKALMDKNRSQ